MPRFARIAFALSLGLSASACADGGDGDVNNESTGETTGDSGGDGDAEGGDDDDNETTSGVDGDGDAGGDGDGDGACIEVTTAEWIGLGEGVEVIIGPLMPSIGDPEVNDTLQIELYNETPELDTPIDLAAAPNDNYASCNQCVRVLEDQVGQAVAKQYYQSAGTITFFEIAGTGEWRGQIEDVTLVEVAVDGAFNSTPVEGGGCMTISGVLEFDTLPSGG